MIVLVLLLSMLAAGAGCFGLIGLFSELDNPSGALGVAIAFLVLAALFGFGAYKVWKKRQGSAASKAASAAKNELFQQHLAEAREMTELPIVPAPIGIMLKPGERCCYQSAASVLVIKNQVVGRTGSSGGVSVRVAKGVTLHSGSGGGRTIRQDVAYTYPGIFSITDQRFVMTGEKGFEYPLEKLTSILPYNGYEGATLQFGRSSFTLLMDESFWIAKMIDLINADKANDQERV